MMWAQLNPNAHIDMLGFIPEFLEEDDPRPAKEQFNDRYGFGGGWQPMPGFQLLEGANGMIRLKYPGDPVMSPLFMTKLRDEMIVVYEHAFVLILRKDGTWEVARMD